jgi:hypothetical protein
MTIQAKLWFLKQVSTGTIVEYGYNEVNTETFLIRNVDLVPGEEYRLVVRDSVGDGILLRLREGSVRTQSRRC